MPRFRSRSHAVPSALRAWLLLSLAAAGCYETPQFSPASLVDRPRILAVVAEPPEVTPGAPSTLSVLLAGADNMSVKWRACSTFSSFGAGSQYGENTGDRGCGAAALELGEGRAVQLPAAVTAALFGNDELVRAALGSQLPEGVLDQVRRSVGVAFSVEADVLVDGKRLRALKRVLVSENPEPARNPPPAAFNFGPRAVHQLASGSFTCVPDDVQPLRVQPGQKVVLSPLYDGADTQADEPWVEEAKLLDARGVPRERTEQAFYSWFASKGSLEEGMTEAPERDNRWTAPTESGCVDLWLVLRDGNGGESACGVPVNVGDVDNCAVTTP